MIWLEIAVTMTGSKDLALLAYTNITKFLISIPVYVLKPVERVSIGNICEQWMATCSVCHRSCGSVVKLNSWFLGHEKLIKVFWWWICGLWTQPINWTNSQIMADKNYIPGGVQGHNTLASTVCLCNRTCANDTVPPAQCVCVTARAQMTQCRHRSQCFSSPFLEFFRSYADTTQVDIKIPKLTTWLNKCLQLQCRK